MVPGWPFQFISFSFAIFFFFISFYSDYDDGDFRAKKKALQSPLRNFFFFFFQFCLSWIKVWSFMTTFSLHLSKMFFFSFFVSCYFFLFISRESLFDCLLSGCTFGVPKKEKNAFFFFPFGGQERERRRGALEKHHTGGVRYFFFFCHLMK